MGRDAEQAETASAPAGNEGTRIRPFADEDIYFFVKHIDNTAVIRAVDPASERASWKMIGAAERGDGAAEDQLPTGTVAIEHRQPRFLQHHVRQPDTGPDRQTENHKRRRSTRHSTP